MATNTATPTRLEEAGRLDRSGWLLALLAAIGCVLVTVALSAESLAGESLAPLGGGVLVLVTVWCLLERRVERTLVVFALYVGLLDGYLKLKTGSREVTLARDLLLWAIAAGALWRMLRRGERLSLPPLSAFVFAFALVTLIQLANTSSPGAIQSLGGLRQHLEFVPLFFLGYAVLRTPRSLGVLLVVLVAISAANGIVSYRQSTLSPVELATWGKGYSERVFGTGIFAGSAKVSVEVVKGEIRGIHVRPFGLGSEIGAGAVIAALALPALLALLMTPGRLRAIGLVCAPAVALAIVTSGSRAALIACLTSMVAFVFLAGAGRNTRRLLVAALLTALVVVSFNVLGSANDSARRAKTIEPAKVFSTYWHERGGSVRQFGADLIEHPLGLGLGTVGPAAQVIRGNSSTFDAETEWNLILIEAGVLALLVVILFGGRLILLSASRIRHQPDQHVRLRLTALAAPLVALMVLCFAGPTSVSAPTAPYFWLTAGVLSYWLLGPGSADGARQPEPA